MTVNQKAGQADPTNAQPIQFTAEFSEPVTGFDENDVTRRAARRASARATVVVTPGPGDTYDIAVSGISSDGTVIADVARGQRRGRRRQRQHGVDVH